jgi:glycosyltransferase involved in cell wall biosynthesis
MKFLHITSVFPPNTADGGVPRSVSSLVKALSRLGCDNLVLTTDANGRGRLSVPCGELTDYDGIPVIYNRRPLNNSYCYAPTLAALIKQYARNYDVALINGNWLYFNFIVRRLLPVLDIPYILYPRGTFSHLMFAKKWLKKYIYWNLFEKYNYCQASGIVALTETEYHQIRKYIPNTPIEIIPNVIEIDKYYPRPSKDIFFDKYPLLLNKPYILFLSRLHYVKGLDILLYSFADLLSQFNGETEYPLLVIAGEGEDRYKKELWKIINELKLEKYIVFVGMATGLAKSLLLHYCSFFVLPSRSEGMPVAVLEALACGKPVVITKTCHLPEVAEAQAGLVVDLHPQALAQALLHLLRSDEERAVMGRRAYNLIQDKFMWKATSEKTVNFCRKILAHRHKG